MSLQLRVPDGDALEVPLDLSGRARRSDVLARSMRGVRRGRARRALPQRFPRAARTTGAIRPARQARERPEWTQGVEGLSKFSDAFAVADHLRGVVRRSERAPAFASADEPLPPEHRARRRGGFRRGSRARIHRGRRAPAGREALHALHRARRPISAPASVMARSRCARCVSSVSTGS